MVKERRKRGGKEHFTALFSRTKSNYCTDPLDLPVSARTPACGLAVQRCGLARVSLDKARALSNIGEIEEFARKRGADVSFAGSGSAGLFGMTTERLERRLRDLQAAGLTEQVWLMEYGRGGKEK